MCLCGVVCVYVCDAVCCTRLCVNANDIAFFHVFLGTALAALRLPERKLFYGDGVVDLEPQNP